jgi:hypothetical protein
VEGRGEDVVADVGYPLLEGVVIQVSVHFQFGQVDDHGPVSGFQFEISDLFDGLFHESIEYLKHLVVLLAFGFPEGAGGDVGGVSQLVSAVEVALAVALTIYSGEFVELEEFRLHFCRI